MFKSARVQLTIWFTLIVMVISLFFSAIIYQAIDIHLVDTFRRAEGRINNRFGSPLPRDPNGNFVLSPTEIQTLFANELTEARHYFFIRLLIANSIIFGGSALVSYFLAGKVLQPIEVAHQEQIQFVADASHELRTPLTIMKTSLEVTLLDKHLNAEIRQTIEENLEAVNNLQQLTDRLLLTSLNETQVADQNSKIEHVRLDQILKSVVAQVQILAKSKEIFFHQSMTKTSLRGSSTQLYQLFLILLDNAVKYTPTHGKVSLQLIQQKGKIKVVIKDTGIGISKKDMPHIFDRFYRADPARTKSETGAEGFGLGLSLAKQIVIAHNGEIEVKSKLHQGSEFVVTFPSQ